MESSSINLRHLILKDVADMEYPVYTASVKTEAAYQKAQDEEKQKKIT